MKLRLGLPLAVFLMLLTVSVCTGSQLFLLLSVLVLLVCAGSLLAVALCTGSQLFLLLSVLVLLVLAGAVIAAGRKTGGTGTPRYSKLLYDNFRERSGAVICRDLKGLDTGTVLCPCEDCVRNAVRAAGEALAEA